MTNYDLIHHYNITVIKSCYICACIIKTCAAIDIKLLYWYHNSKFHIDISVY